MTRQHIEPTMEKMPQVGARDVVAERMIVRARGRLFVEMLLVTFFCATISLLPAKPIDRTPARECDNPAK